MEEKKGRESHETVPLMHVCALMCIVWREVQAASVLYRGVLLSNRNTSVQYGFSVLFSCFMYVEDYSQVGESQEKARRKPAWWRLSPLVAPGAAVNIPAGSIDQRN